MQDHITIRLGGKDFRVEPLTIEQLERLQIGVLKTLAADPVAGASEWWAQTRGIFAAALCESHPDMTEEKIAKLRMGSFAAVSKARNAILVFAGLIDEKALEDAEKKLREGGAPGESPAAAA